MVEKQLIAPALWQYPLTEEGLQEAIKDAETLANETWKSVHHRYKHTLHVVKDNHDGAYYGPMGSKRLKEDFGRCEVVYTANPDVE